MAVYTSMSQMMLTPAATAPVPTQTFNAANMIGTPVPQVGDNAARPPYAGAVGAGTDPRQVVLVVIGLFAIGYIIFHINFER